MAFCLVWIAALSVCPLGEAPSDYPHGLQRHRASTSPLFHYSDALLYPTLPALKGGTTAAAEARDSLELYSSRSEERLKRVPAEGGC